MKKRITLLGLVMAIFGILQIADAQVVFRVTSPSGLARAYINGHPADWGGRVTTPLNLEGIVVNDGSANPTLGCEPSPTNAYTGKIVVIRRGNCEFGAKSLNAQRAGAAAVVVINNQPGGAMGMGAGAVGGEVTIPVFSISQEDGEPIISAINAGETVSFSIYPAAFALTLPHYAPYYAAVPFCFNRESIDSFGVTVRNSSRSALSDVVVRYQVVDKSDNSILLKDSVELPSMLDDEVFRAEWDLSSDPFVLAGFENGRYAIEYVAYYKSDALDPPGTYRTSQEFGVRDDLWSHENLTQNAFRPGAGGDHTDGSLFFVPEDIESGEFVVKKISWISSRNASETTLAGKAVGIFFSKIVSPTFDFTKNIFDETQFEILGYADFVYTDEAQNFQRMEVDLYDVETDEIGIALEPGAAYIATVSYNGPNAQMFHGYSLDLTYPSTHPVTPGYVWGEFNGTNRWVFYTSNERMITNATRLHMEINNCMVNTVEVIADDKLRIYPNPSTDFINIDFKFDESTDLSVILADMNSRVIRWQSYKGMIGDQVSFDVRGVPAGNYILHFATKNGQRAEKVIVVK